MRRKGKDLLLSAMLGCSRWLGGSRLPTQCEECKAQPVGGRGSPQKKLFLLTLDGSSRVSQRLQRAFQFQCAAWHKLGGKTEWRVWTLSTGPYGCRVEDFCELLWAKAVGTSGEPQEIRLETSCCKGQPDHARIFRL